MTAGRLDPPPITGQRVARYLGRLADRAVRADRPLTPEDVAHHAIAQARAPLTPWQRYALAGRLAYVALTGRKP